MTVRRLRVTGLRIRLCRLSVRIRRRRIAGADEQQLGMSLLLAQNAEGDLAQLVREHGGDDEQDAGDETAEHNVDDGENDKQNEHAVKAFLVLQNVHALDGNDQAKHGNNEVEEKHHTEDGDGRLQRLKV